MFSQYIYQLHPLLLALLILGGTVSVSLLCVLVCRYFVKIGSSDDTEFKVETYSDAFGIAFAILLGLIIVTSWSTYDKTDDFVRDEVNYLDDLYRLAEHFNEPQKKELRDNLKTYVRYIIDKEWPFLPLGKYSDQADDYLFHNFNILYKYGVKSEKEELVLTQASKIQADAVEKRRMRILNAQSSLSPFMWIIVISCNLIAFFILALAAKGPTILHMMLQTLYALGTGLMLLLVVVLDRPFYYGIYYGGGITSSHFENLLADWKEEEANEQGTSSGEHVPHML